MDSVEAGRLGGPGRYSSATINNGLVCYDWVIHDPCRREGGLYPPGGLTPGQQADCLIHQSMDPKLLGRMWPGWAPVT